MKRVCREAGIVTRTVAAKRRPTGTHRVLTGWTCRSVGRVDGTVAGAMEGRAQGWRLLHLPFSEPWRSVQRKQEGRSTPPGCPSDGVSASVSWQCRQSRAGCPDARLHQCRCALCPILWGGAVAVETPPPQYLGMVLCAESGPPAGGEGKMWCRHTRACRVGGL